MAVDRTGNTFASVFDKLSRDGQVKLSRLSLRYQRLRDDML